MYSINNAPVMSPVTSGLVGQYIADSWNGLRWTDTSGNGNHVTSVAGTLAKASLPNGRTCIYGNTSSWLTWPTAILPPTYTLFHVAKYNGAAKQRIFNSNSGNNWLSGFWEGKAGVCHHDAWLTNQVDMFGTNWFLSTDQNALYR